MATTQETTSTALVKSDRAGRTRYTKTYKSEVVSAYERSGMSAAAGSVPNFSQIGERVL